MTRTVRQLAELVRGQVHGDHELPIAAARPLSEARPGDVTFLEHDKYLPDLDACPASAASSRTVTCTLVRPSFPERSTGPAPRVGARRGARS